LFDFGNALRIWAHVSGSGVFIVQPSGKPGEKRKHGKANVRELETCDSGRVCFPFVGPGVMMWEGDSNGAALWLIDGYDVFVIDTYSCDRP